MNLLTDMFKYDGQPHGLTDRMRTNFGWADDFFTWNDEDWTITGTGTPTFASSSTAGFQIGGWLVIGTPATDNADTYLTQGACMKCDVGKSFAVAARIACTEAATSAANIVFGLINAGATDLMIDDAGGPIVAADKALLYKVDGTMSWSAQTAKTTGTGTNVRTSSAILAYASATIYELGIVFQAPKVSGQQGVFRYFINGVELATHPVTTGNATSTVTAQPTAVLTPVIGIKAGTAAAQTLHIDWMALSATR